MGSTVSKIESNSPGDRNKNENLVAVGNNNGKVAGVEGDLHQDNSIVVCEKCKKRYYADEAP
ncbi:hypothetical protein BGZ58_004240, partial [Dissophora ornata]